MKQNRVVLTLGMIVYVFLSGCVSQEYQREIGQYPVDHDSYRPSDPGAASRTLPELTESSGLSDYLAYAALNNPGLESAFSRWKAALERVPQATSLPDPRFTYQYFIEEVETRVGGQRESFGLAQMFPWFGKLTLRGDVALQQANTQRQRYEAAKLKLFFAVKDAYYEYYYLAKAIAVTQENVNLVKHLESVARTRFKTAAGSHPDVIRAQVELGKLTDRLRTLQDLREPIAARLNASLNRPVETKIPWPAEFTLADVSLSDEQLLGWLTEHNPDLKAIDFEITRQKQSIELAKKDYYPDITMGLNYIDTANSTGGRNPSDDGKDPIVAMVSINVPIWQEKYAAGVREARARYYSAIQDRVEKKNTLGSDLKLVSYNFRDAARKIDLYRNALLPKATESLKVTEASYLAGQGKFLDLIDAQRILLEFQLAYERATANYEQSLARLEMLVGKNIPRAGNETGESNVSKNK